MKTWFKLGILVLCDLLLTLVYPPQTSSFTIYVPEVHQGITRQTLKGQTYFVAEEFRRFTPKALEEIVEANKEVDDVQGRPDFHFDNEEFVRGISRLVRLRELIILRLETPTAGKGQSARELLGGHTH